MITRSLARYEGASCKANEKKIIYLGVCSWPKISTYVDATGVRCGHIAAIDIAAVNDRNRHIRDIHVNHKCLRPTRDAEFYAEPVKF